MLTICLSKESLKSLLKLGGILKPIHQQVSWNYPVRNQSGYIEKIKSVFLIRGMGLIKNYMVCVKENLLLLLAVQD